MTDALTRPDDDDALEALLPDYVTGRLDRDRAAAVEAWVARDPGTRAERVAFERALAQTIARRVDEIPADVGLDRLMARLAAETAAEAPRRVAPAAPAEGLGARLRRWFAGPQLGFALAALVVVQAGIIATQVGTPGGGPVEYRSAGPAEVRRAVRVAFAADASEAIVRRALIEAGATLVAGPSQLGEYWVRPIEGDVEALAARLRERPGVQSASVDPGGPPPLR